ncbi:MAG: DNA polymerase I [Planctomycetes bacterium]|nr:DNA polymerase I [Planctomycetota bacterium]
MPEKLFIIDAFAHIYQFYYAIKGLTGPDGEPVNALYGFARMIRDIRQQYDPDYLAVAFDSRGELVRHKEYPDYKANREPMPEALQRQIPLIEQFLDVQNIPCLTSEGHEADDVLATLARRAAEKDIRTVIVTTDKDAEQLIDERTSILHIHKSKEQILDAQTLKEIKGIRPEQVVDVMALAGDSADNVPGVRGVGPKTALKLIAQFGALSNLYENLDQVPSDSLREKLRQHKDDAEMAYRLVQLNSNVPLKFDWADLRDGPPDRAAVDRFYSAMGFQSLRSGSPVPPSGGRQASLFTEQGPHGSIETVDKDYRAVTSLEALPALAERLRGEKRVAVDLETTSLQPRDARIVGIALSWAPHQGVYVATDGPEGSQLCPIDQALEVLRPILEGESPRKVGQNLKYDIAVLKNYGIELGGIGCDSMVASYLLEPAGRSHGLNALARRYLSYEPVKIEQLIGAGADQRTMAAVPVGQVTPYACEDADLALQLCELLLLQLEEQGMADLLRELELPLVPVLAAMEWTGIKVDTAELSAMSVEFADKLAELEQRIHAEAGETFNVNSPKQLSAVLFEKMQLPRPRGGKRTTGYSTAVEVLQDLKAEHPIAKHLLEYRELKKLKSTYADALLGIVHPRTGRVHASFNQTITATGRLSSSAPNLQNIPVRTPLGRRIRAAFVPGEDGMSLLSADYSQVELRIMAHCSGDSGLRRAFEEGRDIHRFVAAQVGGVPEQQVTASMRQQAKAVNFGIIYGLSPYGLSRQIGVPVAQAERFISQYFKRYPKVKEFIGRTIAKARQDGFVKTLAGRRRRIEGLRGRGAVRGAAERIAINTVMQGSAADLIKKAMISIHAGLPSVSPRSHMLLQIHDELVFETPDEDLEKVREFVRKEMCGAFELDVPLKVDTAAGKNWAEAK